MAAGVFPRRELPARRCCVVLLLFLPEAVTSATSMSVVEVSAVGSASPLPDASRRLNATGPLGKAPGGATPVLDSASSSSEEINDRVRLVNASVDPAMMRHATPGGDEAPAAQLKGDTQSQRAAVKGFREEVPWYDPRTMNLTVPPLPSREDMRNVLRLIRELKKLDAQVIALDQQAEELGQKARAPCPSCDHAELVVAEAIAQVDGHSEELERRLSERGAALDSRLRAKAARARADLPEANDPELETAVAEVDGLAKQTLQEAQDFELDEGLQSRELEEAARDFRAEAAANKSVAEHQYDNLGKTARRLEQRIAGVMTALRPLAARGTSEKGPEGGWPGQDGGPLAARQGRTPWGAEAGRRQDGGRWPWQRSRQRRPGREG